MNIARLLKRLLMSFMFYADGDSAGGGGDDLAALFQDRDGGGDTPGADEFDEGDELDIGAEGVDENARRPNNDEDDDPNANDEVFEIPTGGGQTVRKTKAELIADASKYHGAQRKFDEAAAIRKDAEEKLAVLPQREQQLGQVLEHYIRQSQAMMSEQQPNWEALLAQDPKQYLVVRHQWEQRQSQLAQAQQAKAVLDERNAKEQAAIRQGRISEAAGKIVEAIPDWSDPVKAKAGAQAVNEYLAGSGIPSEMISQMDTAEVFLIARKAMLYDQAIARRKAGQEGVQTPTRTARPGAGRVTTGAQQEIVKARKSFDAAPSVDTLAAFFK